MTVCKNWYERVTSTNGTFSFSVIQPADVVGCPRKSASNYGTEIASMIEFTMFFGLLFLLYILCRSCSRTTIDWYRLIALYIIGTLGVPISLAFGPQEGGFNRIAGIGVLTHNLAEIVLLTRVWFGGDTEDTKTQTKIVAIYVWVILTLDTFIPLAPLFLILMIQGAFLDWTLSLTFIYIANAFGQQKCSYYGLAATAALMHILTIQPLFFGFATSYSAIGGITVIFLIPTFLFYMWFSADALKSSLTFLHPNPQGNAVVTNNINENLVKLREDIENNKDIKKIHVNYIPFDNLDNKNDNDIVINNIQNRITGNEFLITVVENGLKNNNTTPCFRFIFVLGFLLALTNSLIVFFSPCYINTKSLVCK